MIVFSQWDDMLGVIEYALGLNRSTYGALERCAVLESCRCARCSLPGVHVLCVTPSVPCVRIQAARKAQALMAAFRAPHRAPVAAATTATTDAAAAATGASSEEVEGPWVLLMLVKRGGKGLNLVEATHVFMVEPLLNPALDAQAIGRLYVKSVRVWLFGCTDIVTS